MFNFFYAISLWALTWWLNLRYWVEDLFTLPDPPNDPDHENYNMYYAVSTNQVEDDFDMLAADGFPKWFIGIIIGVAGVLITFLYLIFGHSE